MSNSGGKARSLAPEVRKVLKRRNAIEPSFGQLKAYHRMDRCYLKGEIGDPLHAVHCAAGDNLRWLLRMTAKNGLWAVLWPLLPHLRSVGQAMVGAAQALKTRGFVLPLRSAA